MYSSTPEEPTAVSKRVILDIFYCISFSKCKYPKYFFIKATDFAHYILIHPVSYKMTNSKYCTSHLSSNHGKYHFVIMTTVAFGNFCNHSPSLCHQKRSESGPLLQRATPAGPRGQHSDNAEEVLR